MGFLGALGGAVKGAAKGLAKGGVLGGAFSGALASKPDDNSHEGFGGQRVPGKLPPGAMTLTGARDRGTFGGKSAVVGKRKMQTSSRSFSRGRR